MEIGIRTMLLSKIQHKKSCITMIIIVLIVGSFSGCNGDNNISPKVQEKIGNYIEDDKKEESEQEKDEIPDSTKDEKKKEPLSRDNSKALKKTLNSGIFTVGIDIPEGRYRITGDGNGNLLIYDGSGEPEINELLGIGDFGVTSVTTELENEYTIEIIGINNVTFTPADTEMLKDALSTGKWIVGLDIEKGKYEISSAVGTGNIFIYDKRGWPVINEILGDGQFGVKKVTVTLEDGYLIGISGLNKVRFESEK